jgi:predicted  nucleic acid-binding Zn-ribbon protein
MKNELPDMAGLLGELRNALAEFTQAEDKKKDVEREMTRCTNNLNAAQKAFDDAAAKLKGAAPWGSEWHSQRKRAGTNPGT